MRRVRIPASDIGWGAVILAFAVVLGSAIYAATDIIRHEREGLRPTNGQTCETFGGEWTSKGGRVNGVWGGAVTLHDGDRAITFDDGTCVMRAPR